MKGGGVGACVCVCVCMGGGGGECSPKLINYTLCYIFRTYRYMILLLNHNAEHKYKTQYVFFF